ncbi:hypothetical protein WCE55_12615 [Luteimonas sp. MJ293]
MLKFIQSPGDVIAVSIDYKITSADLLAVMDRLESRISRDPCAIVLA